MSYFTYNSKRIYYAEMGEGTPLLLLHGNSASSRMFERIANRYAANFHVILIDFLGHGSSDRLGMFPTDLWFDEAQQIIGLLREKQYAGVNIIGSSGGALVAINVALEAPEMVRKVVADSFEGIRAAPEFTANLSRDRQSARQNEGTRSFFRHLHGDDWESVVDNDTRAVLAHEREIGNFFHKPISSFEPEILLTGSKADEFTACIAPDYYETLFSGMIREMGHGSMHIFETGGHPAMFSNEDAFHRISTDFLQ